MMSDLEREINDLYKDNAALQAEIEQLKQDYNELYEKCHGIGGLGPRHNADLSEISRLKKQLERLSNPWVDVSDRMPNESDSTWVDDDIIILRDGKNPETISWKYVAELIQDGMNITDFCPIPPLPSEGD